MIEAGNIISPFQRELLISFSQLPDSRQFYLTGGTALAEFYFHHRLSYDLDLFTSELSVIAPLTNIMEERFSKLYMLENTRKFETFCEYVASKNNEKVKIDIAYDSPFRFKKPVLSELGVYINDYEDIIVDKLLAFFGRSEPRDAIDIYFILQREPLDKLIKLAKEKDPGFDNYWLAMAFDKVFKYPEDIKDWSVEMLKSIDIKKLKKDFSGYSRKLMDEINKQG